MTESADRAGRQPAFEMTARPLRAELAGLVSRIVGYRETCRGHVRHVEPASLDIPLVISFGEPFAIGLGRAPGDNEQYGSFTSGLFAGPVTIDSFGASSCLQVNFTPLGARRFFGMPMSKLAEQMVMLDDALGAAGHALREELGNAPDWEGRFDIAERFLLGRFAMALAGSPEVAWAYDRIATSGGRARIASIAERLGWSRKHLAQQFAKEVGLAPKSVARIARLNRAIDAWRTGQAGWAGIAADCGYADQAHMTRDFRELAGAAPAAWAAR
jgi:AraC-like DNA-binding protein